MPPFRLSVFRSSKTYSINSLYKHHYNIMVHYYVMWEAWTWLFMTAVLMSNGHHKDGPLLENSTCRHFFLLKVFSPQDFFEAFPTKEQSWNCNCSQFFAMLDWMHQGRQAVSEWGIRNFSKRNYFKNSLIAFQVIPKTRLGLFMPDHYLYHQMAMNDFWRWF